MVADVLGCVAVIGGIISLITALPVIGALEKAKVKGVKGA